MEHLALDATEPNLVLGETVRKLREERGWTREALAYHSNLSFSTIGRLERGERDVPLSVLVKLAETFDIELTALLEEGI